MGSYVGSSSSSRVPGWHKNNPRPLGSAEAAQTSNQRKEDRPLFFGPVMISACVLGSRIGTVDQS
jgi:hypothetical protein